MNTIVFGAGGQLGREWLHFLENAGVRSSGFTSNELDITDKAAVNKLLQENRPDLVVNCAAFTDVDGAEEQKDRALAVNAEAAGSLARECAATETKLVHFSTDYVFPGRMGDKDRLPNGYPEDHPTHPVNWYGETKLRGERAILDSGVSHLIIRTSWLCGRHGSNFVKTMLRLAENKDRIDVVNDQWGSPSFAENVVHNTYNLTQKRKEGIYHVTSRGLTTWHEIATEIFDATGIKVAVNPVSSDDFKTKAKRPRFSKLDIKKLERVEGAAIIDWKEGLHRLLNQLPNKE